METEKLIEKVNLEKLIEEKINSSDKCHALWSFLKKPLEDCKHHLSQITRQMSNYDIHDEKHSSKVLENIENLLGDKANSLSCYELILIYSSCFLHDAAMALPKWEYNMLKAAEGCNECYDNKIEYPIRNDFKPAQSLSSLKSFIDKKKKKIYGDFTTASKFVFSPKNEEDLQIDIAKRVNAYEIFRNEFADKLEEKKNNLHEYLNYSDLIRSEFIRKTHHSRIVDYINNLKQELKTAIGDAAAVDVLNDLSQVCRAHGETIKFIEKLNLESNVDQIGKANLRFVAIVLRLGDIIHFSSDRAPLSLFSEKMITDSDSLAHWRAKFNDTRYELIISQTGKKTIKFHAYCSDPQIYYFLHEYLDCVDAEIGNYFSFLYNLDFLKVTKDNYDLQLNDEVDRTTVSADPEVFTPDHTAKFTMDQSKILSLLMGAQLYKDEFLCLRELYQNSLDACKCMQAQDEKVGNLNNNYKIVFGLKTDCTGRQYIYCLDNGTGMTKEIVKNYFLRIGNSYYKSCEFIGKNIDWMSKVNPTSQFGIGVLSCFMLGETIEVTTKYFDPKSESFAFCLNSASEQFFYVPVDPLDEELIGEHGTLIKIILSEEARTVINNDVPENYHYLLRFYRSHNIEEKESYKKFIESLFYKINAQIAITHSNIDLFVNLGGKDLSIVPHNEIFDYRKSGIDLKRIESYLLEYYRADEVRAGLACRNFIKNIPIHISDSGVELDTFISLPLKGIPNKNQYIFLFKRYLWPLHNGIKILVDGITVPDFNCDNYYKLSLGEQLSESGRIILNFIGKDRPILSIDRNSIVQCPNKSIEICERLVKKLVEEVVKALINHLEQESLDIDSEEAFFATEIIFKEYSNFSGELFELIRQSKLGALQIQKFSKHIIFDPTTINDVIMNNKLKLDRVDFRTLNVVSEEILVGKMLFAENIQVLDTKVTVSSNSFKAPSSIFRNQRWLFHDTVIRADKWSGKYSQYDMVTSMWPLIPERTFQKITKFRRFDSLVNKNRAKPLYRDDCGLEDIALIEPTLVNPKVGISSNPFGELKSLIGHYGYVENSYSLSEFDIKPKQKKRSKYYALFAYIAPQELSKEDKVALNKFKGEDDTYVKGVQKGWSILFLGYDEVYYILPGIREKSELIDLIPHEIRNRKDNITYYNLDDTKLF